MKKHKLFAALAPAAMLAAAMLFFSPTASAQVTVERRPGQRPAPVQPPVVTVDVKSFELMSEAEFREILVKRLNALEAENKELKSQFEAFKTQFANHTHDLGHVVGKALIEDVNKKRVVVMTVDGEDWGNTFKKTGPPSK